MELVYGRKKKIFRFSRQYTNYIPWIRIKIIFSCLENVRNRFVSPRWMFSWRNRNLFRVNTPNAFLESGSNKCFHAAQSILPHKITPIWVIGRQGGRGEGTPMRWSPSCSAGSMRWSPLNFGSMSEWVSGRLPPLVDLWYGSFFVKKFPVPKNFFVPPKCTFYSTLYKISDNKSNW
jgi:hypothetical protein